ncbi:nucleotidyltransferase domain-containing protein [Microbacterium sp. F1-18]
MLSDTDLVRIAHDLAATPGVVAVALGGSRARGTHAPDSDVDLGVYVDGRTIDRAAVSALPRPSSCPEVPLRPGTATSFPAQLGPRGKHGATSAGTPHRGPIGAGFGSPIPGRSGTSRGGEGSRRRGRRGAEA